MRMPNFILRLFSRVYPRSQRIYKHQSFEEWWSDEGHIPYLDKDYAASRKDGRKVYDWKMFLLNYTESRFRDDFDRWWFSSEAYAEQKFFKDRKLRRDGQFWV